MKIVNGRWVDNNGDPINELTSKKFVELGRKVSAVYGKNISYDKINIVNNLTSLSVNQHKSLSHIIDSGYINKL